LHVDFKSLFADPVIRDKALWACGSAVKQPEVLTPVTMESMWLHLVWYNFSEVSKEYSDSIVSIEEY
jgi:hypothetical protein